MSKYTVIIDLSVLAEDEEDVEVICDTLRDYINVCRGLQGCVNCISFQEQIGGIT